jgi:hypothetical protein
MKATQSLPTSYHPSGKFDLKNVKLLIIMNLIGLVLMVFAIWFFSWLIVQIRIDAVDIFHFSFSNISSILISLGKLFFSIVAVLVIHEGIHAFFFWFFSGQKPVIGFKGAYAYASMPGWYFPRNQYLVIGISPLILITLFGILLIAIVPVPALSMVLVALVINTSGAIGDLVVVIWLLTKPVSTLALDQIDTIEFFTPEISQTTGDGKTSL